ncbi:DUF2262 domain-containing protein [Treponema pedis]|uniref:DUF2262 domain-containing protein n=1 Tax=Treponema pedis TaxID=409322 RepID=UPI001982276C|nr:DUF2262 domain-containing protein [Treponema pedis]QSI05542.1 DUF2262 domain-containing protein [Treponema pedis]
MNLLEYMREQNKMTQEVWENTFEKREHEILVLRHEGGGARKKNGFWDAAVYFLAYLDCTTGLLHKEEGRLVYPVSDNEHEKGRIWERFEDNTIYRLKVRTKISENVSESILKSSQNRFLVVEIIEKNPPCPELEEILTEYKKPVILQDNTLGELTLNKKLNCFEGTVYWQGKTANISLEVNKDNKSGWSKAKTAMKTMLTEQEKWDREMRDFAAKKLTPLAGKWRESAEPTAPEITEQSFARRIELKTISITAGGSFSAYFDDDDMFFGHCVTVQGSLKKGVISANMEG